MGVQLFLDVLRSLCPTHVVRLISSTPPRRYDSDILKMLPPITEKLLTSTPGLFTPVDRVTLSSSFHPPFTPHSMMDLFPGEGGARKGCGLEKSEEGSSWLVPVVEGGEEGEGELSSELEMYGSSDDQFSVSECR